LETNQRLATIDVTTKQLESEKITREFALALAKLQAEAETSEQRWDMEQQSIIRQATKSEASRAQLKADQDLRLATDRQELELRIQQLTAEAESLVRRAEAISPDLVAALQSFGSQVVATEAAKAMGPMAILGGSSVADVLSKVFANTQLGGALASGLTGRALPETTRPASNGGRV
jgi:major vault protein